MAAGMTPAQVPASTSDGSSTGSPVTSVRYRESSSTGRCCGRECLSPIATGRSGLVLGTVRGRVVATLVGAAARADMVRPLHAAAVAAADEVRNGEVVMAPAVALPVTADFLLWKCAHRVSPGVNLAARARSWCGVLAPARAVGFVVIEQGGENVVTQDVTVEQINAAFQKRANGDLKGILGVSNEPLVSIDYVGNPNSSTVDMLSTMVVGTRMIKVMSWYDNEWGYSMRCVDLAELLAAKL